MLRTLFYFVLLFFPECLPPSAHYISYYLLCLKGSYLVVIFVCFLLFLSSVWFSSVQSLSCVQFFAIPWTVAHQAPLSIEFSRQDYLAGCHFPPPGGLPHPGIKPVPDVSPA